MPPQEQPFDGRLCATTDLHARWLASQESYVQRRAQFSTQWSSQEWLGKGNLNGPTLRVRTVVHVVHNPADISTKVSDAQIDAQIKAANACFEGNNPQTAAAAVFASSRGIPKIRLEHVQTTCTPTEEPAFVSEDIETADTKVKTTSLGGRDPLDATRYLNIWVCVLRPFHGYATFPGAAAHKDGVVISYTAFGPGKTALPPLERGYTATHEVAHWLDVQHTFRKGNKPEADDGFADTPAQVDAHKRAPAALPCCGNHSHMFMNFMDLVADADMCMFTEEQAIRMRATLLTRRSGTLIA